MNNIKKEYEKYYHPKFQIVAKLIEMLYSLEECRTGGCCHIVTDDNNIRNSDLEFVIKYCDEESNKDRIDSEISKAICQIMLQMTNEQRIILFYTVESDFWFDSYEYIEYETYFENVEDPEYIIKEYGNRYNTRE